jgi:hypothetical protein
MQLEEQRDHAQGNMKVNQVEQKRSAHLEEKA